MSQNTEETPRPLTIELNDIDFQECGGECEGCGGDAEILMLRYGAEYCPRCWQETRGTR